MTITIIEITALIFLLIFVGVIMSHQEEPTGVNVELSETEMAFLIAHCRLSGELPEEHLRDLLKNEMVMTYHANL